jgi:hypothetical protein
MKKYIFIMMFFTQGHFTFAQQQKFDIINYSLSTGWKKQATDKALQLTKQDEAKGTYCLITLYKAIDATSDSKTNFNAAWESLVNETLNITATPQMQPVSKDNGWEAQTGTAAFESEGSKGVAILVASTGFNKLVNILVLTNTDTWQNELGSFFESVSLTKPAGGNSNNTRPVTQTVQPAAKTNYTYNTTNFDNGWVSTIHNDYVLVTKGEYKVYLSYAESFNESEYSGTGREKRHHYWDNFVAKYFVTTEKRYNPGGALSDYSSDYIEGWATDRQTNEKRYIAMILNILPYTGNLSVIIASAPDVQKLRQQFPKADVKYPNDLLPMYSYNKFAIGKNDLAGTWSGGGGGTMNWYSTSTGQNVGATGAVMSDVFTFNTGNTYTSTHNGATGWVGSMNTYQQQYKGTYTVTDWTVTATKRFDGKTTVFNAWFEVLKGGRVLHLEDQKYSGSKFDLFKTK